MLRYQNNVSVSRFRHKLLAVYILYAVCVQSCLDLIPNYNQQDATFLDLFISTDAVHVSGGSSAHHQEHKTVHTASGIVNCNDRVIPKRQTTTV